MVGGAGIVPSVGFGSIAKPGSPSPLDLLRTSSAAASDLPTGSGHPRSCAILSARRFNHSDPPSE